MNGDVTFATAGAVIDGKHITGDVTIKNSQIDGSINNWGGGYTVRVYIGPTTVTNNRIVNNPTSGWYGPVNSTCNVLTWSGNTPVTIDAAYNVAGTLGRVACTG